MTKATTYYALSKKNPNKVHVCRSRIPDATKPKGYRQIEESFATADEAYAAKFKMQARIDSGEFETGNITFGEAAYHWLGRQDYKPITRARYDQMIKYALAKYRDMPLLEVSQMRKELHTLVRTYQNGGAIRKLLVGTIDLAMAEGDLPYGRRHLAEMDIPRKPRYSRELIPHTAEQLNTILETMPDKYRLIILLMRGCGLRQGEAAAMEIDALHDGYLEVKRGVSNAFIGTPKSRYEGFTARKVPIPHWLQPEIDNHVKQFAQDGILFPGYKGRSRYVATNTVNVWCKRAATAAGLPTGNPNKRDNFTEHQYRKNWFTQFRAEMRSLDIDFGDVEEWAGHKNLGRDVYAFQGMDVIQRGRNLSDPRKVNGELHDRSPMDGKRPKVDESSA